MLIFNSTFFKQFLCVPACFLPLSFVLKFCEKTARQTKNKNKTLKMDALPDPSNKDKELELELELDGYACDTYARGEGSSQSSESVDYDDQDQDEKPETPHVALAHRDSTHVSASTVRKHKTPREPERVRNTDQDRTDDFIAELRIALNKLATTTDPLPLPAACIALSKTMSEPDRLRSTIEAITEDAAGPFDSADVHAAQQLLEEKQAAAEHAKTVRIRITESAGSVAMLADACNRRWIAMEALVAKGILDRDDAFFTYLLEKLFVERRRVIALIWKLGAEYA